MATPQTNAANQPQPIAQPNVKNQVTPPAPQPLTTEQQATIQASGLKPGTLQTGPVTGTTPGGQGLAPAEQTFQAVTTLPDATAGRNAAAAAVRPPGTVFDPQTGTYKDPTSGSTYAGSATGKVNAQGQEIMQAPPVPGMGGSRFTTDGSQAVTPGQLMPPASLNGQNPIKVVQGVPDITKTMDANTKSLIDSGLAPSDTGVLTTDNYTLASATLGTAISTMASNPLGAALSQSTDATNYLIQQNLQQYQELSAGAANPQLDPVFKLLLQHQADIRQNMVSQIQDIHAQTETQLTAQAQQNKALEGQARAAVNAAGQVGSMVGEGFIAAQMQNNQAALQSIVQSENKAINDAQAAYEQQDMDTAMKMADLADKRRTQAHDLLSENASLAQNMEQMSMQRQQVALQTQSQVMQLKQQGMSVSDDMLGMLAKQNLSPDAIPDSVWQEVSTQSDGVISTGMAKLRYKSFLNNQEIVDAKNESDKIAASAAYNDSIMKIATVVPSDTKLTMKMPDGTSVSMLAKNVPRTDLKQTAVDLADGKYLVTTDANGKEINREKLGESYVAPHFDTDTGKWISYDPTTGNEPVIIDNGVHGEGGVALQDEQQIVSKFEGKFGKEAQGPGGKFSHSNLTAYDFSMPSGTEVQSPISNGVIVASGTSDTHLTSISGTMKDFGNYVDIMNVDKGYVIRLAHLKENPYKVGAAINSDTKFISGNTGFGSGPHMHVEFRTAADKAIKPNNKGNPTGDLMKGGTENFDSPQPPRTDIAQFEADTGATFRADSKSSRKEFASWKNVQTQADKVAVAQQLAQEKADRATLQTVTRDPDFVKTKESFSQRRVAKNEFDKAYSMAMNNPKDGVAARTLIASLERVTHPNPSTVIRSSEIANIENSRSLPGEIQGFISKIVSGQNLTPQQITSMKTLADNAIGEERKNYDSKLNTAYTQAIDLGIKPSLVGIPVKSVYATGPDGKSYQYDSVDDPDLINDVQNNGYSLNVVTE